MATFLLGRWGLSFWFRVLMGNRVVEGPDEQYDWVETWKKMEAVYENNKDRVKAIGESRNNLGILEVNEEVAYCPRFRI